MAKDVITRFKLETTQYDSKIKNAAKELSDVAKAAKSAGSDFGRFTKDSLEAARSLGSIATSSVNAKDRAKELVTAFNDVARSYNQLTKEQQQSDFGKALSQSLTQLQQRIRETKQEMQGLGDSMGGGLLGGGKLSGMLQVFGGNMMTKLAGAAASFVSEMGNAVQQGIELAKQGEGIRIAFERLGRGDILQGLREATHGTVTDLELMKAAVKFNDFKLPVEELGTMLAFAQQKAKDTGQSVDYMVDSIVTGLGRKSLMILDNLGLSANEIKDKMKQTGDMTKAVGSIIREQMAKAGDYIETAADRATKADVEVKNAMEELGRTFQPLADAGTSMWTALETGALKFLSKVGAVIAQLTEAGRIAAQYNNMGGSDRVGSQIAAYQKSGNKDAYRKAVLAIYDAQIRQREQVLAGVDAWRKGDRSKANGDAFNQMEQYGVGRGDDSALRAQTNALRKQREEFARGAVDTIASTTPEITDPKKNTKQKLDELQKIQQKISKLTTEAYTADSQRVEEIQAEIAGLQEEERKLTKIRDLVTGNTNPLKAIESQYQDNSKRNYNTGYAGSAQSKADSARQDFAMGGTSASDISGFISLTKQAIAQSDIGSEMYTKLTEQMKDATTMSTLLNEMMERGVEGTDLTTMAEKMKAALLEGDIPDEKIKEFIEQMNEKIREQGGVELEYNGQTGEVKDKKSDKKDEDDFKKFNDGIGKLTGGLSQVSSGLKAVGVEIPKEVDDVIGVISGVSQIISGVGSIISLFSTTAITANTAAVVANTAALGVNTATNFIPFFAGGGIVPHAANGYFVGGNKFSGDTTPIMANAGELVLNKAQQGNLAAQLEGSPVGGGETQPYLDGEKIFLGLQAYTRRSGLGEIVTSER